ncbi:MAG: hypothetical protein Q8Q11_00815 [bacterium]|nr:hypothetical protein [bacterium]MDZ4248294.1 hypothetical protein [Patescibacteria group bacterium]
MRYLRYPRPRKILGSIRRFVFRADHALMALVGKADEGVVGFVEWVEHGIGRMTRAVVAAERLGARKVVAALRIAISPVLYLVRTVVAQLVFEVAAVCGGVFRAPGRLGRSAEALVAYWTAGVWRFFGRITLWVSAPIRKRVANRAKRQALDAVTMTPDHKSHRELLALLVVAAVLIAGAAVLFGGDLLSSNVLSGIFQLERLAGLPSAAWHWAVTLSPIKLTVMFAAAALTAATIVFWFRMLRDSYRREYPTAVEQTQWRLVTTLLFIPGAVLYFFKQYNRLTVRKFAARHVVSLMVSGVTVLVATSTYGTLWYFNQQAAAEVAGAGYQAPVIRLDPNDRRQILSRDQYGQPLKPATTSRRDPFAPIPGETTEAAPSPSPSPTSAPQP